MTGLHEALDDIAAEITPIDPPVELAMRLGRRKRHGRGIAAIAGTAGAIALSAAAVAGIPALTGPASTSGMASGAGIPLARPVLLESPQGSAKEYGDAHLVNAATLRLFHRLACTPVPSALSGVATNDAWKATVGYTAAQWNAPGSEVVSCDASGGKYVLGKAVVLGSQVTSATAQRLQSTGQWVVDVTLNSAATAAFAQLTTSQATRYYPASQSNWNDAVLASTAFVINGDVQSAPVTEAPITIGKLMIAGRSRPASPAPRPKPSPRNSARRALNDQPNVEASTRFVMSGTAYRYVVIPQRAASLRSRRRTVFDARAARTCPCGRQDGRRPTRRRRRVASRHSRSPPDPRRLDGDNSKKRYRAGWKGMRSPGRSHQVAGEPKVHRERHQVLLRAVV